MCEKEISGNYHKYTCDTAGIDFEFYICYGDCNKKFCDSFMGSIKDDPIKTRFEILDLQGRMKDLSKCYACGVKVNTRFTCFFYYDKKWCPNCCHHADRYIKKQERIKNPGPIENRFEILDL